MSLSATNSIKLQGMKLANVHVHQQLVGPKTKQGN